MDDYAGRVLADRYRLPLPPSDAYEFAETRAFDTYSGQEVLVRQVPLPETVDAEVVDEGLAEGRYGSGYEHEGAYGPGGGRSTRRPADPVVRRAIEAAQAAAQIPDHPRLDQVFDVFAEDGSLWIVSELVAALPLAALVAEKPLTPYRAAEVASEVLTALRALHAHGWVHRNITMRTVLVCDNGRVMLTGLAAGAAEEALCGYDPVPDAAARADESEEPGPDPAVPGPRTGGEAAAGAPAPPVPPGRIDDPYGVAGRRPAGGTPAQAESQPEPQPWPQPERPPRKGPATPLAAERARQARMNVVGPVTERWAPEQAGPVHENWQLAAPVGPATDLWALGSLLFRAVQGHAPYPEDSAYELVQLVCGEPPAFAEECGPLRPVVESLLRQDPTERPEFEELRGWLRSLVRSAPEPEAGQNVVPSPPFDRTKLPVVRRRGELVRRRRAGRHKSRHKRGAGAAAAPGIGAGPALGTGAGTGAGSRAASTDLQEQYRSYQPARQAPKAQRTQRTQQAPRRLGRMLLALILLGLVAAVAYAVLFMPKAEPSEGAGAGEGADGGRTGQAGSASSAPAEPGEGEDGKNGEDGPDGPGDGNAESPTSQRPDPQSSGPDVPEGFALRKDPEGFRVAVAKGWERVGATGRGQVTYADGEFELIVVPGRDAATGRSSDPLYYQREREVELQPFRDSTWATSTGMRRIDVGGQVRAEGQFTWTDADGGEVYVRNAALLIDGRYHVVLVKGPESERDEVTRLHEQAVVSYRPGK
ncbi:protein kinase [Streptomyces cavernicola]|uniref:Protein kinase n=1 Tax=Streptomyces cavernicola TaxID=3043613 RepID=A0ABT6SC35_9ACTN|nr:protein kinase [Streptomyces sp. B-S-A6]MDI3405519.1 protein kinase [Streptomyces sp. B-S-A6]